MKNRKKLIILIFLKKSAKILLLLIICLILFTLYEIFSSKSQYYIEQKNLQIPIYTYHDIVTTKSEIKENYMQTTLKNFKKQIVNLKKIGYTPITYQDLLDYSNSNKPLYKRSCIITFDDGYKSIYEHVFPLIKEYNIPITIFVINSCIGGEGYLNWDELKEMHGSGLVDIYSHGLNHIEYDKVPPSVLLSETEEAYSYLTHNLNDFNLLKVFAYPYGLYTEDSIETLWENGYIQNLMDGKINKSNNLNMSMLHRVYPLNDSVFKILLKQLYKSIKY